MKAVKALQEAMERIETLQGMVAVNNITIDEQQHQISALAARLTALESALGLKCVWCCNVIASARSARPYSTPMPYATDIHWRWRRRRRRLYTGTYRTPVKMSKR
jgi:hypothetical protein